jgi:TolB protein
VHRVFDAVPPSDVLDDYNPAWSPAGTKIAFQSTRDGNAEIHVMNADDTGQTNLSDNPAFDTDPSWSPDGTKIAFTSGRDGIAIVL